jgi:hypothetical protein
LVAALASVLSVLAAAGCSDAGRTTGAADRAAASRRPAPLAPAAEAGGVCELLEYGRVKATLGVEFAVAASAQRGETRTCVIQPRDVNFPDLALSITATAVADKAFTTGMLPASGSKVEGLGKAAYSIPIPAAGLAGPGIELAWLSATKRLMVIRYRLATPLTPQDAAASLPNLVALATTIDGLSPSAGGSGQPSQSSTGPAGSGAPSPSGSR